MEKFLSIVTVNKHGNKNMSSNTSTIKHEIHPFRISDIILPKCNTGHVYILFYLREKSFTYIGATLSISTRIKQHNSGNGSQ